MEHFAGAYVRLHANLSVRSFQVDFGYLGLVGSPCFSIVAAFLAVCRRVSLLIVLTFAATGKLLVKLVRLASRGIAVDADLADGLGHDRSCV